MGTTLRRRFLFTLLFLVVPMVVPAEPVIGGDDLDDHGSWDGAADVAGWKYVERSLASLFQPPLAICITRPNDTSLPALAAPASGATATSGGRGNRCNPK